MYRLGLCEAFSAIGVDDLAPDPELPSAKTTVVLAIGRTGQMVGGVRVREGAEVHRKADIIRIAGGIGAAIEERERDGLTEGCGAWHVPETALKVRQNQNQNQNSGLQGLCGGDSGSSAFLDDGAATPPIVAMPVLFDGSKCQATGWWVRFDVPDALNFINRGFATGSAEAVRTCLKNAF